MCVSSVEKGDLLIPNQPRCSTYTKYLVKRGQ